MCACGVACGHSSSDSLYRSFLVGVEAAEVEWRALTDAQEPICGKRYLLFLCVCVVCCVLCCCVLLCVVCCCVLCVSCRVVCCACVESLCGMCVLCFGVVVYCCVCWVVCWVVCWIVCWVVCLGCVCGVISVCVCTSVSVTSTLSWQAPRFGVPLKHHIGNLCVVAQGFRHMSTNSFETTELQLHHSTLPVQSEARRKTRLSHRESAYLLFWKARVMHFTPSFPPSHSSSTHSFIITSLMSSVSLSSSTSPCLATQHTRTHAQNDNTLQTTTHT